MDAKISSDFWGDPAIEELTMEQRLAALWAITNERTTFIGFVEASRKRFEFETGCPYEALESLPEAHPKGFIQCENGIWIRRYIARQFGTGTPLTKNNFCKPILQALRAVEGLQVFTEVLSEYPELQEKYDDLYFNTPELPLARACQAQEQSRAEQSRADSSETPKKTSPSSPAENGQNSRSEKKERGAAEPLLYRARRLFWNDSRRSMPADFALDSSEESAWKKNKGVVAATTEADWLLLEWAYSQTQGDAFTYRRKALAQILNNWNGAITSARDWAKRAGALGLIAKASAPEEVSPEGWEGAFRALHPDANLVPWRELPPEVRDAILDFLKKNKGGGQ